MSGQVVALPELFKAANNTCCVPRALLGDFTPIVRMDNSQGRYFATADPSCQTGPIESFSYPAMFEAVNLCGGCPGGKCPTVDGGLSVALPGDWCVTPNNTADPGMTLQSGQVVSFNRLAELYPGQCCLPRSIINDYTPIVRLDNSNNKVFVANDPEWVTLVQSGGFCDPYDYWQSACWGAAPICSYAGVCIAIPYYRNSLYVDNYYDYWGSYDYYCPIWWRPLRPIYRPNWRPPVVIRPRPPRWTPILTPLPGWRPGPWSRYSDYYPGWRPGNRPRDWRRPQPWRPPPGHRPGIPRDIDRVLGGTFLGGLLSSVIRNDDRGGRFNPGGGGRNSGGRGGNGGVARDGPSGIAGGGVADPMMLGPTSPGQMLQGVLGEETAVIPPHLPMAVQWVMALSCSHHPPTTESKTRQVSLDVVTQPLMLVVQEVLPVPQALTGGHHLELPGALQSLQAALHL
eukprot:gene10832-10989_t